MEPQQFWYNCTRRPLHKDALLVRVITGDPHVGTELRRHLDRQPGHDQPSQPGPSGSRRTVAELLAPATSTARSESNGPPNSARTNGRRRPRQPPRPATTT
jgi:hypothetical protein